MRKHLLLGTAALLIAVSGYAQSPKKISPPGKPVDRAAELAAIREMSEQAPVPGIPGAGAVPYMGPLAKPSSINWSLLCGSMNVYGMLGSNQRALQYNPSINALSFIHRKSQTYTTSPALSSAAENGAIVAEISTNWGVTWDSTLIYANDVDWGRYPQGGIYNPAGNTSVSNAYVVGSGPTVGASSFSGNWYASKRLNTFDNVASTAPGAQQFYSFGLSSYPANMPRHAWPRTGLSVTNDGIVRALGILGEDLSNTTTMRGYAVITGTFNGSAFDWKIDSLIPNAELKADGYSKNLQEGQMAWNQDGTVGYVVGIGVMSGATKANRAMQPIIWKMDRTTNPAATWTLMSGLDFNTTFSNVAYSLPTRTVTYPSLEVTELPMTHEFDITVDANNNVHIGIVFMSGYSTHPDSLNYYTLYESAINPTEDYRWQHLPGQRPYIYDFYGNGVTPWKVLTIDSMSSEAPGVASSQSGFQYNPWDNTGTNGQKIQVEGRLQLGRTPDGNFITFSWAESDTNFTDNFYKYNTLPDIKTRCLAVNLPNYPSPYTLDLGPNEQNISEVDNNVRARATLHFMSPTTSAATLITVLSGPTPVQIKTPLTVTNSYPYSQLTNNVTWYSNNTIEYKFPSTTWIRDLEGLLSLSKVYPNPVKDKALLALTIDGQTELKLNVLNNLGQVVKQSSSKVYAGENEIVIDLEGLNPGIYFLNLDADGYSSTKKLIVE